MSWLYSIVFAGLLFSSNGDTGPDNFEVQAPHAPVVEVASLDETEKFEQSYPINANGRISVSNVNGSIVVEAWDRNEVKLEATKTADSKETLAEVDIKIDARPDVFSVEADYQSWKWNNKGDRNKHRRVEVQFRLSVPRTALLNEIETVNGSVTVSNFVNLTKISAVNGNVSASNLRGAATLSTVNGEVIADFDRLETGSRISLSTVNGRVNLTIPSDANATIKADSLNGSITNDFGLPVRKGQYVGRDMYGRVGSGEVQIKLDSVNGGLSVNRKNDGKSANPAVNLLKQKSKDDEDWDDSDDQGSTVNLPRINKEIGRAVKDSEKHRAAALKEAHKEVNKIKPEIVKATRESIRSAAEAIRETATALNSEEFKQQIEDANAIQQAALARMDFANFNIGTPFVEKKTNSFAVKGTPKVVIEAKGCGVNVRGWDKHEVKYVVTSLGSRDRQQVDVEEVKTEFGVRLKVVKKNKREQTEEISGDEGIVFMNPRQVENVIVREKTAVVTLKNGKTEKYDLNNAGDKTNFERKYGKHSPERSRSKSVSSSTAPSFSRDFRWDFSMFGDRERVRIEVFVPKKSNLTIMTDGEIRLEGVSGEIELEGGNGAINIRDVDGNLHLSAAEAQVRVIGFRGSFDSQTECGDIYLEGDFEKLTTKATEGTVFLTLPQNSNASFTSNSEIETEGFEPAGNKTWRLGKGGASYNFDFTNGKLVVRNASLINSF
ncbi:MAG: DUF4097 family beta strand repeat protein [Saprospiraceae bacterium]|nr:DUF4097 family beta strand repeat protein [Pyrinomonadaceae bacterium]